MTSPSIIAVDARIPGQLQVTWSDGSTSRHDLRRVITEKGWAAPLRDPRVFSTATVTGDGREIVWPGSGVEFSADGLWEDAHPAEAPTPKWMTGDELRRWIEEMGFTWDTAADALGISRRTIGYYLSGELDIPKQVWLACMHLAAQKRNPASVSVDPPAATVLFVKVSGLDLEFPASPYARDQVITRGPGIFDDRRDRIHSRSRGSGLSVLYADA